MNKDTYQELCKVFDQILTNEPTPEIIANNYLHILNLNPESLSKYNTSKIENFWLSIRFKLVFIIRLFQSIFNRRYQSLHQKDIKSDVLFVSHLTNSQQLSQGGDAYFGDLPYQLLDGNISSSIALIKHTKISNQQVLRGWMGGRISRFVLSSSLGFVSETRLYLAQRRSRKRLESILKDLKVDKELAKGILCHHMSSGTFSSLRIAKQVAEIANKVGAKFVVTTYEGYAWERLVYYFTRKASPNIKCLGYQHAAVFEHQHAIKRPLDKKYNPDTILTSGIVAKDILEKSQFKRGAIICLGSPKYVEASMIVSKSQSCLVVPEGIISESLALFTFSLECAIQHQEQKFIWRLHPLLSFERLKKQSSIFKNLPDNITLSEGGLDHDIQKCDSVLYSGSTAVVNAINAGLRPIYYQHSSDELSIDPIYTHQAGKFIVHNQYELSAAIFQSPNRKNQKILQDFAQDFYTHLDANVLFKELMP